MTRTALYSVNCVTKCKMEKSMRYCCLQVSELPRFHYIGLWFCYTIYTTLCNAVLGIAILHAFLFASRVTFGRLASLADSGDSMSPESARSGKHAVFTWHISSLLADICQVVPTSGPRCRNDVLNRTELIL